MALSSRYSALETIQGDDVMEPPAGGRYDIMESLKTPNVDFDRLSSIQLKEIADKLGLKVTGSNDVLIGRIREVW